MKNVNLLLVIIGITLCLYFSSCNTPTYLLNKYWSTSYIGYSPTKNIPNDPLGNSITFENIYHYKINIIRKADETKALEYSGRKRGLNLIYGKSQTLKFSIFFKKINSILKKKVRFQNLILTRRLWFFF